MTWGSDIDVLICHCRSIKFSKFCEQRCCENESRLE